MNIEKFFSRLAKPRRGEIISSFQDSFAGWFVISIILSCFRHSTISFAPADYVSFAVETFRQLTEGFFIASKLQFKYSSLIPLLSTIFARLFIR